jgi:hypothetical protein
MVTSRYAYTTILGSVFAICTTQGLAQTIAITTKDGDKVNTTISGISNTTLYTPLGNFAFSSIDTASFEVRQKMDQKTYDRLEAAGATLNFTGGKIVIDKPIAKEKRTDGGSKYPFKGANTIIFKSKISDDSLYTLVARKLVSEGFSIDVNNREFLQMKTADKITRIQGLESKLRIRLTITIVNREVIVKIIMITTDEFEWTYRPSKILVFKDAERQVLELFSEFGEVYYALR